jgi:hypothetical protein
VASNLKNGPGSFNTVRPVTFLSALTRLGPTSHGRWERPQLAAAAKAEAESAAEEKRKAENRKRSGPVPRPPSKEPDPKTQRNFTDPDSRVLLTKDGFIQGYNAQAAVDGPSKLSWRMD